MRFIGRGLCLSAAVMLVFGLAACGNKEKGDNGGKKERHIVFIFKSAGQYSEVCRKGADKANNELKAKGVSVEFFAPETSEVEKQIALMKQKIAEKVDAIIISPDDAKAIAPVIQMADSKGVKVFTWDSDAPTSKRVFYVAAANDVKIGEDIAESLAKDLGGKGKVQIMSGGRLADNLNQHVDGMKKGFAKYPGITVLQPDLYNDEDTSKATDLAIKAIQKDPDIVGFACANSQGPPGVGEAITQCKKIGKIKVWGLSLPSLTKEYLKSDAINGVMLWDPSKLTYLTAILVNDWLDNKPPKDGAEYKDIGKISVNGPFVIIPGVTFTKQNVDQYNF